MATSDCFLDFHGEITGESGDDNFKDTVEIESWNFGGTSEYDIGSQKTGSGQAGRVTMGPLNFTAKQTAATTQLFERLVQGAHIPQVTLNCRKPGGGPKVFFTIDMDEVYITAHQVGGANNGGDPIDAFSLGYGKILVTHFKQNEQGDMQRSGSKFLDLRNNTVG
jgi:type VI secretion system secreted protein Hcp